MVLYQKSGWADWDHYSGLLLSWVQALLLFASLRGNMDLHTFSAEALVGSFILRITCSLSFFLLSPSPPPYLLFPSPTLWGADQFTASLGGVRLVPALCDWPRRCRPSVVLSCSPPFFFSFTLFLIQGKGLFFSLFFSCQPLLHKPHMQTGPKSYDLTLIQHSLPLSSSCSFSFCLFSFSSLVAVIPLAHLK